MEIDYENSFFVGTAFTLSLIKADPPHCNRDLVPTARTVVSLMSLIPGIDQAQTRHIQIASDVLWTGSYHTRGMTGLKPTPFPGDAAGRTNRPGHEDGPVSNITLNTLGLSPVVAPLLLRLTFLPLTHMPT